MLVIDGIKYELWKPPSEDALEQIVKEHAQDIFGGNSIYLDTKQKMKSKAGIATIPDGYAIVLGKNPCWHIVEIELSSHSIYDHVVTQVSKFINGIKNHSTQKEIADLIYGTIEGDDYLKLKVRRAIEPAETYKFVSELISKPPELTVIIEQTIEELDEALRCLAISRFNIVEFKTFARQDIGLPVHSHLFEPLYKTDINNIESGKQQGIPPDKIIIKLTPDKINYKVFYINAKYREHFPTPGEKFDLYTDAGSDQHYRVYLNKYYYIIGVQEFFKKHKGSLKDKEEFIIEVIESMRKYRLRKA